MGQPTDLGNGGKSLVTSWCMCNINWCMFFCPSRCGTIASSWADQWIFLEKGALPFGIPSSAYVILPKNSWVQSPRCKPKVDSDVCSLVTCGFPLRQVQLHRDLEGKWRTSGCPRVNTWCSTAENSRDKRLAFPTHVSSNESSVLFLKFGLKTSVEARKHHWSKPTKRWGISTAKRSISLVTKVGPPAGMPILKCSGPQDGFQVLNPKHFDHGLSWCL